MSTRPWHKRYHSDAIRGYREMSLELRGAYLTLLDMMYDDWEPLADNEHWLSGCMKVSVRKYKTLRDELIKLGKIYQDSEGRLTNKRFEKERENVLKKSRKCSENGTKGADKTNEKKKKANKNNGSKSANAEKEKRPYASKIDSRSKIIEDTSSSILPLELYSDRAENDINSGCDRFAFAGRVIKLTHDDFSRWEKNYPNLSLGAELEARDAWLASDRATDEDRKRWFIATSSHLRNQNQKAANEQKRFANGGYDANGFDRNGIDASGRDRRGVQYAKGFQG